MLSFRVFGLCSVAALAGCSLSLTSVSPAVVVAGQENTLTVEGTGLDDSVQFTLLQDAIEVVAPVVGVEGDTTAQLRVPAAAPAGLYDVLASRGFESASLEGALTLTTESAQVVFVDIGQGDATLVIASSGEVLLIDGGGLDAGPRVREAIDTYAGGRLDKVVASHYDADHLAGLVSILSGPDGQAGSNDDLLLDTLYAPTDDDACESQTCNRFRALLAYDSLEAPTPGDTFTVGDIEATVVAIDGRVGSRAAPSGLDANGRSLVLELRYAERRVLVLGDLTGGGLGTVDLETPLSEDTGPVDVLRSGHHGSATSSAAAAVNRWAPRLSVISMGTDNAYCHPAQDALDNLASASVLVVGTGQGTVEDIDRCDGATSVASNVRLGQGTMVLTIAADGALSLDGDEL